MAWVANGNWSAYLAEIGPYLPTIPALFEAPEPALFPADLGEIDYFVGPAGQDLTGDPTFEAYAYTFRSDDDFNSSDDEVVTAGLTLYVVAYNLGFDDPATWTPSVAPESLVYSDVAAAGTATRPPAPANDLFENRVVLNTSVGSLTTNVTGARRQYGEHQYSGVGDTVWYELTAHVAGNLVVRIDDPVELLTTATVWHSSVNGLGNLPDSGGVFVNPFEWSDPGIVQVQAGDVVYLQVDTFSTHPSRPDGTVTFEIVDPPPNDAYADRITLSGASGSVSVDTVNSSREPGEQPFGNPSLGTVWYEWTCPASGNYFFQTSLITDPGQVYQVESDLQVAVRASFAGAALARTNFWSNTWGRLNLQATAGTVYRLQVTRGRTETGTLEWGPTSPPANDNFASRALLVGGSGSIAFTTIDATEESAPFPDGRGDVWFEWIAPSDEPVEFTATVEGPPAGQYLGYFSFGLGEKVRRVVRSAFPGDPWRQMVLPVGSNQGNRWVLNPRAGASYFINLKRNTYPAATLHWGPSTASVNQEGFGTFTSMGFSQPTGDAAERTFVQLHHGATQGTSLVIGVGRVQWVRWVAPFTGQLEVKWVTALNYDFDYPGASLAIYSGPLEAPSPATLALIASGTAPARYSEDGGTSPPPTFADPPPTASVTFGCVEGQAYFFQSDYLDFNADSGTLSWLAIVDPPPNDAIADAYDLTGTSGTSPLMVTIGATTQVGVDSGGTAVTRSSWAKWTAPAGPPRLVTFTFSGPFSTVSFDVYRSTSDPATSQEQLKRIFQNANGGSVVTLTVAEGHVIYFRARSSTHGDARHRIVYAPAGVEYDVGEWITPPPIEISGFVQVSSGTSNSTAAVANIFGNRYQARWVIDQQFGAPKYAYAFEDARVCALGHVQMGDTLYHPDHGWDYFTNSCAIGHFNDAIWVGTGQGGSAGLNEDWDHGAPFLAAFYEMNMFQTAWALDLSGAVQRWSPGIVSGLQPGQVVETQTTGSSTMSHFGDGTNSGGPESIAGVRPFVNEVLEYDVRLGPGSAVVENSVTYHLAAHRGPNLPLGAPSSNFRPTVPWFSAGDVSNHLDTSVISAGATVAPQLEAERVGAQLKHAALEGGDPNFPLRPFASFDLIFLTTGFMTDGAPPAALYDPAGPITEQQNVVNLSAFVDRVLIQPPPYRILTPKPDTIPWLRMVQRNDGGRVRSTGNEPTSVQESLRAYPSGNTYA